ncbi:SGNH/GDSL hydrolase family protein [Cupriavidus sp. CV2]|uniref:SGNH/GDSL hydrolase family protein n=1 Tax=Cupriavidus ulmosensis TaxID=3065913 RepID=UPI00296AC9EF|nr:SGNH/GDSL hydrolase family protein [Cupriavidus sp. CV2]MDW3683965.1 SGNH/GDSL hydrolase family protein [Cupriavidus sp. CV2]
MRIKRFLIVGDSGSWTLRGTSIGGGTDNTTPWVSQIWPHKMVQALDQQYPNSKVKAVNRSYGGQNSNDVIRRIAGWSMFPIDVVILALGTNDCANNANPPSTTAANLVAVGQRLRYYHGMSLPIVLCTPWNSLDGSRTPYIAAMQDGIAGAGTTLGGNTAVARMETAWASGSSATYLQTDNIHPNSAGHALIAPVVTAAVVSVAGAILAAA